ncbi:glycosyltransferase family 4 protein [Mucilaginibacter sabulilitoris]|uniref:Glycosyltransferase family 4 protein n=1 Tax=Mucilaginibacter sabulilitoris TaxID=1173583 RepID=A0ABZ0TT78_9SPHI|nr:glycosyltransferase family 4 protein [Mucilaginibacter sabulilitoris]WPU95677.1 glycosyltransferase family 4 protein [Mucilaginibacter sabulilitoris]
MKSQKAVHILHSIEFSGAEIMLYQASDIFRKNHINVTLLACELRKGKFELQMLEKGYAIDSVGSNGKIASMLRFYRYFRKAKFDIVHIHTEDMYLWKVIALRLTGHQNIVRSYHNNWTFKGWVRLKRTFHRRLASLLGVKGHAIGAAVEANERKLFRNPTTIINNWISLNPKLLSEREQVRAAKRRELNIPEETFVLISIGGCSPIKNHNFIIDLIPQLRQNNGLNVYYLHVGTGADENTEKSKAAALGPHSNIYFKGNRKDIPELLMAADVYLMPSLFEGLSIALLEAMYYNGLVIVNDAPGLNNMVIHETNGYVIDVSNIQAYTTLLKKIAQGEIDTSVTKAAAREFVKKNFSMDKNAEELVRFYNL